MAEKEAPGLALCCAMAEKEEGRGPHLSGSDIGRQLTERRNGMAVLGSGGH
jgi:hypothetical protein